MRLIDADALAAEFLRLHQETDPLDNDWFTPYLLVKDADTIDAMPRWIPVEERLPEQHDDGSVDAALVTDGYLIHMAYFSSGKWHYCSSGEMKESMFYIVTHWMPLPKGPKEE